MSSVKVATREAYQFAAEPKAVKSRAKYRGPNEPRVSEYEEMQNDNRVRPNQNTANDAASSKASGRSSKRVGTNNAAGTEENLPQDVYAELIEKRPEDEAKLVPYYFVDRAPTPEYKPLEPGVDAATQIEDRELFDYELEVQPILQVLVGKTLQQSQIELREEDEKLEEMRHKMRFEKTRNAELMVTQRKEALHIRKQEEKQRREKQHAIQENEQVFVHQKYISRLIAKAVTFGMNKNSINILAEQGVLNYNMKNALKMDYNPYLVQNSLIFLSQHNVVREDIQKIMDGLANEVHQAHAASVKKEFDRKKKIVDDKKAEEERLDAEQRRRRERRRLLRLHFAKSALLDSIKASVVGKAQEVEDVFSTEITDIFPSAKDSVSTIGGLLGELWLIISILQEENQTEVTVEELVQVFVKLFSETYKPREFAVYLNEEGQQITQNLLTQMADDLVSFNQNKTQKIDELYEQLGEVNCFQNLGTLQSQGLLDVEIFKKINKALLYIYFSSIDYKVPEKKVEKAPEAQPEAQPDAQPEAQPDAQPDTQPEAPKEPENPAAAQPEAEKVPVAEPEPQQEEEEYKPPEITPLEQAIVAIKRKIKLNFLKGWDFNKDCDAIARLRIPLNRQVKDPNEQVEENQPAQQEPVRGLARNQTKLEKQVTKVVEEVPQESFNEKVVRLIATDDFIEPFNGTTFEKEKEEFTEQVIAEDAAVKVFNASHLEGKNIALINERGQDSLRKRLISLLKQNVAAWKEADSSSALAKVYIKYKKNEKVVFDGLIEDPEKIAVFDIEMA